MSETSFSSGASKSSSQVVVGVERALSSAPLSVVDSVALSPEDHSTRSDELSCQPYLVPAASHIRASRFDVRGICVLTGPFRRLGDLSALRFSRRAAPPPSSTETLLRKGRQSSRSLSSRFPIRL
eukprot:CAMPEP_0113538378 /NCGR_PEP_ID=MMETSP0015_2-20120614/7331_1 /TAXON_ID=2838 /ORGANISM="Odontella" /LENGTH=124 /DNA_ID=CAMNT_0000437943 /DNA_START=750 /DNA_END=1121 /DNA_ORIENTATION=+ /assembly_acc=CAM_ASM_000160